MPPISPAITPRLRFAARCAFVLAFTVMVAAAMLTLLALGFILAEAATFR